MTAGLLSVAWVGAEELGATPKVVINEVAWAGSVGYGSDDEWLELKNTTNEAVDISNWQLTRAASGITVITFPAATLLPPNELWLIMRKSRGSSAIDVDPVFDNVGGLQLADNNLLLKLFDGDPKNGGKLVDAVSGDDQPFFGQVAVSMERSINYGAGDKSESWQAATSAINLLEGLGTPGAENSSPPVPEDDPGGGEPPDLVTTVRINEVYPCPSTTTSDEYIELYNFGEAEIKLEGWQLDDMRNGGSNPMVLTTQVIPPTSYLTLYKPVTKLTLNDTGDDIYLIQPDGFELDHASFGTAQRGSTWAWFENGWQWTAAPTPDSENELSLPDNGDSDPDDEPDDEEIVPSFARGAVLITELLPNPDDQDEFIELYNASDKPVRLKGWELRDKAKRKYLIDEFAINIQTANSLVIQPEQYAIVTDTMSGIALNNTGGETVTLIDPSGNIIATASYPDKAPVNAAYVWLDEAWTWSHYATPGEMNVLGLDEADEPAPQVDIVLPTDLPVTGRGEPSWLGLVLSALSFSAIVGLLYVNYCHQKSS